jgi:hypothetical protein
MSCHAGPGRPAPAPMAATGFLLLGVTSYEADRKRVAEMA